MDSLPVEIIENILKCARISIEDVVNFSSTSHYFRNIVANNKSIWKQKFRDKWPDFVNIFDKNYACYYDEVKYIYDLKRRTQTFLEMMPSRFYKKYELSDTDLEQWSVLLNEREQVYYYLVSNLRSIINTKDSIKSIEVVPLNTPGNKTLQYYASKVLRYIHQLHLSKVWADYIAQPPTERTLEKGAVFVAQWCQPNINIKYDNIARKLDLIADQVKQRLQLINAQHPIFKINRKELNHWRNYNLDCNKFEVAECRQIILAMKDVMFKEMGFEGNNTAYYMPQNSYINEVLEKRSGLPITLAIIYESVARRLGLRHDPISFPAHFLLRFTESAAPGSDWYYIDVFNGGNVVRKGSCPHKRMGTDQKDLLPIATAVQVIERMANNLEVSARQHTQLNGRVTRLRSSLELLKLVNPKDLSALVSLARLYMLHSMDTRPLQNFLLSQDFEVPEQAQRIVHMLRDYVAHHEQLESEFTSQVAQRTRNIMFAVGMVMKHSTLGYKCVIYDWDPMCLASASWQAEMNVNKLTLKHNQPFYNVLVEDGSYRYVAQENLMPTSDIGFLYLNEDVGRYFSHFFETHYVPNAEKENEYPNDKRIRHQFYIDRMLLNNYRLD